MAGPSERSHTLTRSGGLGGYDFLDKAKGLLGGRRVGFSGEAGEGFKNINEKSMKNYNLGQV